MRTTSAERPDRTTERNELQIGSDYGREQTAPKIADSKCELPSGAAEVKNGFHYERTADRIRARKPIAKTNMDRAKS